MVAQLRVHYLNPHGQARPTDLKRSPPGAGCGMKLAEVWCWRGGEEPAKHRRQARSRLSRSNMLGVVPRHAAVIIAALPCLYIFNLLNHYSAWMMVALTFPLQSSLLRDRYYLPPTDLPRMKGLIHIVGKPSEVAERSGETERRFSYYEIQST